MGSKTQASSTTTSQPPPQVMQAYTNLINQGYNVQANNPYTPYPGPLVAGMTPDQDQALSGMFAAPQVAVPYLNQATGYFDQGQKYLGNASDIINTGGDLAFDYLNRAGVPAYENVGNFMSPYIQRVVDTTQEQFNRNNAIQGNSLLGQAIRAGNAFGGDRAGIAQAELARNQKMAQDPIIAGLYNQGYQTAMEQALKQAGLWGTLGGTAASSAASLGNAMGNLGQASGQMGAQVGGLGLGYGNQTLQSMNAAAQQANLQQQTLQNYYNQLQNQWMMGQAFPYQQTAWLGNLVSGLGAGLGGTSTTTQQQPFNPLNAALGLGMAWLASDERLKENVEPIGKTFDGEPIYRYNMKGDPRTQIGLMAQDVEEDFPYAVHEMPDGMKMLDYRAATDKAARRGRFAFGGGIPSYVPGFGQNTGFIPDVQMQRRGGLGIPTAPAPKVDDAFDPMKMLQKYVGKKGFDPVAKIKGLFADENAGISSLAAEGSEYADGSSDIGDFAAGGGAAPYAAGGGVYGDGDPTDIGSEEYEFYRDLDQGEKANTAVSNMLRPLRAKGGPIMEGYALGSGVPYDDEDDDGMLDDDRLIMPQEQRELAPQPVQVASMGKMAPGYNVPRDQVVDYIRQAATARGIDPEIAIRVANSEGLSNWQSTYRKNGEREQSYGPFQLYTQGGLGNTFQKRTGLDPRDPNTWQENVNFALDEARKGGWGPWYGAKRVGITGMQGIDGASAYAPQGGLGGVGRRDLDEISGGESADELIGSDQRPGKSNMLFGWNPLGLSEDARMGLLSAAFATMGAKTANPLQAVGAGGLAGMTAYQSARKLSEASRATQQRLDQQAQRDKDMRDWRKQGNWQPFNTPDGRAIMFNTKTGEERELKIAGGLQKPGTPNTQQNKPVKVREEIDALGNRKNIYGVPDGKGGYVDPTTGDPIPPERKRTPTALTADDVSSQSIMDNPPQTDADKGAAALAHANREKFRIKTPLTPQALEIIEALGITPEQLDFNAMRYAMGDQSVIQGHPGRQGGIIKQLYRTRAADYFLEMGMSPTEANAAIAEFQGQKRGASALGMLDARMTAALQKAKAVAPLVTEISDQIDRTQIKTLNDLYMMAQRGLGGEKVVRLKIALETLASNYGAAMSNGNSVLTDFQTKRAQELLAIGYSKGQMKAAVDQIMTEIDREQMGIKKSMKTFLGTDKPDAAIDPPAATKKTMSDEELKKARELIKTRGRDAIEKYLQSKGYDTSGL